MPAPANVAEFVEVIRKSGLVADDRIQAEVGRLKAGPTPPQNVDQLAAALVRDGVLTRFQAKQVKLGRYKRFEIGGKYRLLELLGVGGMGAVYLCEHMFMKRLVALKVLPVEKLEDPSALGRFYREARAVAAMDHPNIVRAYDIDKSDNLHFLVMEFVDGTSLQEIVARHGPISPERAANYVAQSAYGLQHAHELGLVHRDIKPGNLLLERSGTVKILDMGLARFFDTNKQDNLTEKFDNNCVLGTADYLAPEQAVSNVVDIRADIYALGGSMYFMLTGQSPFPDGTIASKLMAHQTREPKPVESFRKDVPADILAVLKRMMAKDPADRYQTPAELYDVLSDYARPDFPLPPVHEMPDLCPAVLALSGHGSAGPARGGSSSKLSMPAVRPGGPSGVKPRSAGQGVAAPASAGRPAGPRSPSQASVPTGRASQTTPIRPSPPTPTTAPQPAAPSGSEADLFDSLSAKKPKPAAKPGLPPWVFAALGGAGLLVVGLVAAVIYLAAG